MLTAEVLPFPATAEPLAALEAERESVMAELARFQKLDRARDEAQAAIAAVDAEEARLDEGYRQALIGWASDAVDENPPDAPPRTDLDHRRAAAAGNLRSATLAQKAVEQKRMALNAQLRQISDSVFAIRVSELAAQAREAHETACEATKTLLTAAQRSDGIRDALYAIRTEAMRSGNEARVSAAAAAIDAIEVMSRPEIVGDINERARIAAEVKRQLD